jgi:CRISPR-associated endonuclease/helicase Cas3
MEDVELGRKLAEKLAAICQQSPQLGAYEAVEMLAAGSAKEIELALQPKPEPFPRALDLHGLFSNEPDVFGGFTDISQWVRGEDLNADVTVFWREFDPKRRLPQSEELEGPAFDSTEGCAVPVHRLRELLGDAGRALTWDERSETWQSLRVDDLCPGMVVMLPRSAGGYTAKLGWTGEKRDSLPEVLPPGPFSGRYDDDPDSQQAGWVLLQTHLGDAQSAAKDITRDLGLDTQTSNAVVTSSAFHDIGKAHPVWRGALPACAAAPNEFWAKAPFVFALESAKPGALRASTEALLAGAGTAHRFLSEEARQSGSRLLWLTDAKVLDTASNPLRSRIEAQAPGVRAWMRRFLPRPAPDKPCLRHEAASALALWYRYFREDGAFPALTIFLAAAHHGKVRTTLYAREPGGNDVCGVPREPAKLPWQSGWPMDFACAADGTAGEFSADGLSFTPTSPGWTALVADLLGGWESRPAKLPPPLALRAANEPRHLGPFALAYLEALVCAADVRASKTPSNLRHV